MALQRKTPMKKGDSKLKSSQGLSRGSSWLKKGKVMLKATKRLSVRKSTQEERSIQQIEIEAMWAVFREIYRERGPYSEINREYLGSEPLSWMFDHLLEKSKYPDIKYEKWNILMVTFQQHSMKTNGYPVELHKQAIEESKKKYEIWIKERI